MNRNQKSSVSVIEELGNINKELKRVQLEIGERTGRYNQAMEMLKESGASSIEEATAMAAEIRADVERRTKKFIKKAQGFISDYKDSTRT